jgi:hypothetical protein
MPQESHSIRANSKKPSSRKTLEEVKFLAIPDRVSPAPGQFTSISILDSTAYVELGKDGKYCLTTSFNLQVGIIGFDRRSETFRSFVTVRKDTMGSNSLHRHQGFNRFFESISLRYFFEEDEEHIVKPKPRHRSRKAHVGISESHEVGVNAGISGGMPVISPSLSFHVQKNRTVSIERDMESWRLEQSVEKCMHNPL